MNFEIDAATFRQTMGHYPTGVCAITAMHSDGNPVGMIVGSFTSVSLDPPLVAFFPDKESSSWAKIRDCGGFCVNVLADDQEELCRALASKKPDKFDNVPHSLSQRGTPIIEGALAWIDCSFHAIHEAGDHYIALGEVHALDIHHPGTPLLFHKGAYGTVAPLSPPL